VPARANCLNASAATDFSWAGSRYPDCDFIQDLSPNYRNKRVAKRSRILRQLRQGNGHQSRARLRSCFSRARVIRIEDHAAAGRRHTYRSPTRPLDDVTRGRTGWQIFKNTGRFGEFIGLDLSEVQVTTGRLTLLASNARNAMEGEFVRLRQHRAGADDANSFTLLARTRDLRIFTTPFQPLAEPCPKSGRAFHR